MLKNKQRTVISHTAEYRFSGKSTLWSVPKDVSVVQIFKKVQEQLNAVESISYSFQKDSIVVFLHDIEITEDHYYASLYFSMRDKNGVDQATGKLTQKDITVHTKKESEGTAFGCHLVVTLEPDEHGKYYAFREYISGFSDKYLASVLNNVFKNILSKQYKTEEGHKRNSHPMVAFSSRPSEKLLEDIQNGRLTFLELVTTTPKKNLDRITDSTTEIRTLRVELSPQDTTETLSKGLDRILSKIKPQEANFLFKDGERTYSVRIDGDDDVRDVYFAKKREVKVSKNIPQACEGFHGELKNKMIQFAKAETGVGVVTNDSESRKRSFTTASLSQNRTA